jgi:adenylate cyclase
MMRVVPGPPWRRFRATLSAADLLSGRADAARLAGAIVLLGGSAPELGGLRAAPGDPLTPSVQIQAEAVRQILAGRMPQAMPPWTTFLAIAGLGLAAIALAAVLPPVLGAAAVLAIVVVTWSAAGALSLLAERLLDPLSPSLGVAASFIVVSVASFAQARRREALVRRRFEQHLAPAVVERIVREPELVKLSGERREVTALFTDVESFTMMTQSADPQHLVAVLDDYFEGAWSTRSWAMRCMPCSTRRSILPAIQAARSIARWRCGAGRTNSVSVRQRGRSASAAPASASRPAWRSSAMSASAPSSTTRRTAMR